MHDYQKKKGLKGMLQSPFTTVVLLVVFVMLVEAAYDISGKRDSTKTEYQISEKEFSTLEEKKAFLESEIARLSTERGIEEEVRTKFGVAEEGEMMAVIVDEQKGEDETGVQNKRSLWTKILDIFR